MRGRLINPFIAELRQLDPAATAADPDGAGALTSGYDRVFREPVLVSPPPATGGLHRVEKAAIFIPCQVEVESFKTLSQQASGNMPESAVTLVFHFSDLERLGLVDGNGDATIVTTDRLVSIRKMRAGYPVIHTVRTPPGLYVEESQPQSYGLSGGERNLLVVRFKQRDRGLRGAG